MAFCDWMVLFAILLLDLQNTDCGLVIEIYYSGTSEGSIINNGGILQSPGFPDEYIRNSSIYVYYITNTDPDGGHIQLVFSDLQIHKSSAIKLYDGWNTSVTSYVFTDPKLPIFQSSSASLMLVFKTGTEKRLGEHDSTYHGFRAKYTFVKYPRQSWVSNKAIPSTGFCAVIGAAHGQLLMNGRQIPYNYHCAWLLERTFEWRTITLHILNISLSQGGSELIIRNGLTSLSPGVLHLTVGNDGLLHMPDGLHPTFPIVLTSPNFYISLNAYLYLNDSIHLEFSDIFEAWPSGSLDKKHTIFSSAAFFCPFKTAMKSNLQCLDYWDTEEEDGSCDFYQLLQRCHSCKCKNTNKCYSTYDVCDSFNDCGDMSSEYMHTCAYYGERWDAWRVLILFLGAATIIFILRDMLKHRQQLFKACKDCQCSRSCCRQLCRNLFKDSAIGFYLRKCDFCNKCLDRVVSDNSENSSNTSNMTAASIGTSTSAVSVIPVSTTTILHAGRRGDRVCTYTNPTSLAIMPPAYSEHAVTQMSPDLIPTQPPSYEETIANSPTESRYLPQYPPPAYRTMEEDNAT